MRVRKYIWKVLIGTAAMLLIMELLGRDVGHGGRILDRVIVTLVLAAAFFYPAKTNGV